MILITIFLFRKILILTIPSAVLDFSISLIQPRIFWDLQLNSLFSLRLNNLQLHQELCSPKDFSWHLHHVVTGRFRVRIRSQLSDHRLLLKLAVFFLQGSINICMVYLDIPCDSNFNSNIHITFFSNAFFYLGRYVNILKILHGKDIMMIGKIWNCPLYLFKAMWPFRACWYLIPCRGFSWVQVFRWVNHNIWVATGLGKWSNPFMRKRVVFFNICFVTFNCFLGGTLISMEWDLITIDDQWVNRKVVNKNFLNCPYVLNVFENVFLLICLCDMIALVWLY